MFQFFDICKTKSCRLINLRKKQSTQNRIVSIKIKIYWKRNRKSLLHFGSRCAERRRDLRFHRIFSCNLRILIQLVPLSCLTNRSYCKFELRNYFNAANYCWKYFHFHLILRSLVLINASSSSSLQSISGRFPKRWATVVAFAIFSFAAFRSFCESDNVIYEIYVMDICEESFSLTFTFSIAAVHFWTCRS